MGSENPILLHAEATAAARAGRLAEAEALYGQAIRISEHLFDARHPHLATIAHGLIRLYATQGRTDEARSLCEEIAARTDRSRAVYANSRTLSRLADIYRWAGEIENGRQMFRRALAHRRATYGKRHCKVAECLAAFAEYEQRAGNAEQARTLLRSAVTVLDSVDGTPSPTVSHAVREVRDLIARAA